LLKDLDKKHGASNRLLCVPCDVTQELQVKSAVDKCVERFGRIDVALSCAAIAIVSLTYSSKKSLDVRVFEKTMGINVRGSVLVAKYAAVAMSKQTPGAGGERGVIIFTSSCQAAEAGRGQLAYGASKGAINALTLPMARDLGRYGIRVVTVQPGVFLTPMFEALGEEGKKAATRNTPQGRFGFHDEYSHMVCTIIQNGYINGVALKVDGATKIAL